MVLSSSPAGIWPFGDSVVAEDVIDPVFECDCIGQHDGAS